MLNRTLDECTCKCHTPNGALIEHCMACCYRCPHCKKNIVTYRFHIHKQQCDRILNTELSFFNLHREEWFKHHAGKFAFIQGDIIHGFYDTYTIALKAGYGKCGLVPFLIKEVLLEDRIVRL